MDNVKKWNGRKENSGNKGVGRDECSGVVVRGWCVAQETPEVPPLLCCGEPHAAFLGLLLVRGGRIGSDQRS